MPSRDGFPEGYQLAAIESDEKRGSVVIALRSTNSMSDIVMFCIWK